jgi:hypothetical protein
LTEIVARLPRSRGSHRALQALVLGVGLALLTAGIVALRPHAAAPAGAHAHVAGDVGLKRGAAAHEAFARAAAVRTAVLRVSGALGEDAAQGDARGLFVASPDGILATAARVAQWHPLVVRAARGSGFSASLLEALVFVESSGRADAIAGADVSSPAGLTQIAAATGKHVLHLRVSVGKSRRLTQRIDAAEARGSYVTARQLRRWRARFDQRFAPAKSLRATVRDLVTARRRLGRADLAVAAYHTGIGTVGRAISAYGGEGAPSYAQLYFGSAPDHHRAVWNLLGVRGDYYWKVLAAQRVMRLYRRDPAALTYVSRLQSRKSSAEEVMHPRSRTLRFTTPSAIAGAWKRHLLRAIPRDTTRTHISISPFLGQEAHALGRSRRLYAGLRPATLDVLLYIGKRVHELSGGRRLLVTSAVRDNRYQRLLMRVNPNAARSYSMHTTGYAFDIARSYSSRRQAAAFQFVLDRLTAVGAIAYIHEDAAIHIAVASDAPRRLGLLAAAAA